MLESAFEGTGNGETWYLDLKTGQAFFVDPVEALNVTKAATLLRRRSPTLSGEALVTAIVDFLEPPSESQDWR
jgi:hypothetical protein